MLDSITVENLLPGFPAYLGYCDGSWPTAGQLRTRFPQANIVSLAVFAGDAALGNGVDCERGDLMPGQVPGAVKTQHAAGVGRPVVYASVANMPEVTGDLAAAGISRPTVRLLSAHYGLGPHICGSTTCAYYPNMPSMDGTQWTDTYRGAHGSLIDASLLVDSFFGGAPPVSATGPEKWDAADWAAFAGFLKQPAIRDIAWKDAGLYWLEAIASGTIPQGMDPAVAARVEQIHAALAGLSATPAQIAAAVVMALPPAQAGGLTQADVEAATEKAIRAVLAPIATPPAGG